MDRQMLRAQVWSFRRLLREEGGATAIEYAMIAGGVAVAIVAAVNALGVTVFDMYQTIKTAMGA
jgi:pilus assembly protein Flp/PilA